MSFEIFWMEYPRKVGRYKAEKIWRKLDENEQRQALRGLRLWNQSAQWKIAWMEGGLFIPYGSTFLNQKRYLDEPWQGAFTE
jgi:hypothetical protein